MWFHTRDTPAQEDLGVMRFIIESHSLITHFSESWMTSLTNRPHDRPLPHDSLFRPEPERRCARTEPLPRACWSVRYRPLAFYAGQAPPTHRLVGLVHEG